MPNHPLPMIRNLLFKIALAAIALAGAQQLSAQAPVNYHLIKTVSLPGGPLT